MVNLIPEEAEVPESDQERALRKRAFLSPCIQFLLNGSSVSSLCLLEIRGNNEESLYSQLGTNANENRSGENPCNCNEYEGNIKVEAVYLSLSLNRTTYFPKAWSTSYFVTIW